MGKVLFLLVYLRFYNTDSNFKDEILFLRNFSIVKMSNFTLSLYIYDQMVVYLFFQSSTTIFRNYIYSFLIGLSDFFNKENNFCLKFRDFFVH